MSEAKNSANMKTENPNNRRNFLLGATLGTAGAVAAAVSATVAPVTVVANVSASPADTDVKKSKGYHVTAHIEQYYETARM
jgi:hypothetical protein